MNRSAVDSSDSQVAARAAAGDRNARKELFERYREPAYRVALRVTGRHEDALDVVQDGFIRAFERLESFQGDASFKTWFLRIITNRALDLLRSRKVRLAQPIDRGEESGPEPAAGDGIEGPGRRGGLATEEDVERRETSQRLRAAVETLPPDQRAVFALYATGDMTYGQIAEVLGVPVGTVMSRLHHARQRLREALADLAPRRAKEGRS